MLFLQIDHAWTTTLATAKKQLRSVPNLLERMEALMDLDPNGDGEEENGETEESGEAVDNGENMENGHNGENRENGEDGGNGENGENGQNGKHGHTSEGKEEEESEESADTSVGPDLTTRILYRNLFYQIEKIFK